MITSKSNPLIKKVRALADKKYRDEDGLYIVESVKLVNEAITLGLDVRNVFITEKCKIMPSNLDVQVVSDEVFSSISTEKSPEGALAVIGKPENKTCSPQSSCVFLDGVSDPANVGAIIRTCAAAGIVDVYIAEGADAFSPKSVRASMGGIFRVDVHYGEREKLISLIDKPVVVADMGGQNVFNLDKIEEFCLVIGNESHGVSKSLKDKANKTVSIPMKNGMESLNAAVSAGILIYKLTQK